MDSLLLLLLLARGVKSARHAGSSRLVAAIYPVTTRATVRSLCTRQPTVTRGSAPSETSVGVDRGCLLPASPPLSFVRPYHSFSLTRDTSHSRVHRYSHDDAIDVYDRASVQYVYVVYNTCGINVFAAAVVAVAVARLSRTYYVRVYALYLLSLSLSLVPSRYHSVFLASSERHVRAVRAAGIHETARSKLGADSRSSEGM